MKLKKIFNLAMSVILATTTSVMAKDEIKVKYGNDTIEFDVSPQIINDRTMVPLRAIFEAIGATVDWDNTTKTVTSEKSGTTVRITIGSPVMYVNGKFVSLDSPACVIDNRTLVPVRAISEAFNANVMWDESTKTVIITPDQDNNASSNADKSLAYSNLKAYLLLNGIETSSGIYMVYQITGETHMVIAHNPNDSNDNISFTFLNDQMEIMLMVRKYTASNVIFTANIKGTKYSVVGNYTSPQLTVLSCDYPSSDPVLIDDTVDILNTVYEAFDLLMQIKGIDVKICDFGIDY